MSIFQKTRRGIRQKENKKRKLNKSKLAGFFTTAPVEKGKTALKAVLLSTIIMWGSVQVSAATYDVMIDGEAVCCVSDLSEAKSVVDDYISEQQAEYGNSADYDEKISYGLHSLTFSDENIDDTSYLTEVLEENTTIMVDAVLLMADDITLTAVADETTAFKVLSDVEKLGTSPFEDIEVKSSGLVKDCTIKHDRVAVDEILGEDEAVSYLTDGDNPILKWEVVYEYSEKQPIDYDTVTVETDELPKGIEEVHTPGVAGEEEYLMEATAINGLVTETKELSSVVLQEPVDEVIYVGTSEVSAVSTVDYSELGKKEIPVKGDITAVFAQSGSYWSSEHTGVDIGVPVGTEVAAVDGGKIIFAGWNGAYGYMVAIDHGNGMVTRYCHLSKIKIEKGSKVSKGDVIALSGATGNVTGPHLHFEVKLNDEFVDPMDYF